MNRNIAVTWFFLALGTAQAQTPAPAPASGAYRCGNTYSQTPCPNGKLVDAQDPRSAEQRAQSQAAAQRDQRAADGMEQDRRKRDAELQRQNTATADKALVKPKAEKTKKPRQVRIVKGKNTAAPAKTPNAKKKQTKAVSPPA